MKKILFLLLAVLPTMIFFACSSSDDDDLQSAIIGKWRITQVEINGTMYDITTPEAETVWEPTYATFRADGTYIGVGVFGSGSGTYKVADSRVYTYVNGTEFIVYDVLSFSSSKATLSMRLRGSSTSRKVIVEKQ